MSWITDAISKALKRSTNPETSGMVVPQGYDDSTKEWIPVRVGPNGELLTTLSGSNMELYGASVDDRPEATDVAVGTTFTIVDNTQEFKTWMSNGVDWGEEI